MSIDKSLVSKQRLVRHRNVLTRTERILVLEEGERWQEGISLFGLPKVKNMKAKRRVKGGEKKEAAAEAAAAAAAEGGAEAAEAGEKEES
ncbi:MAG: small basic protein [Planctomycetota bacterium]